MFHYVLPNSHASLGSLDRMSRLLRLGDTKNPSVAHHGSESLSSWTDLAEGWFLTEEGQLTSLSMMDRDSHNQTHRRGDSLPDNQPTNGLYSLPDPMQGPSTTSTSSYANDIDSRLTRSMDYGHDPLPLDRMATDPGVSDNLSTSSIDYLWDADDMPESRKFNSLPHSSVYGTTSNGSLPGSPLSSRRSEAPDQTEKIKSKLMAAWNNMRHGE